MWLHGAIALVWFIGWIGFAAWKVAPLNSADEAVRTGGKLLPAFAGATCLAVCGIAPACGEAIGNLPRWLHHGGFLTLWLFLCAGQFLQLWARLRMAAGAAPSGIAPVLRTFWILTELLPAPAALTILISGLRLAYETPLASLQNGYLFWMVSLFAVFFWDGILFYLPAARFLKETINAAASGNAGNADWKARVRDPVRDWQLFAHFASWPFVFLLGHLRPALPSPFSQRFAAFESGANSLPPGAARVLSMLAVLAVALPCVAAVRFTGARLSRR